MTYPESALQMDHKNEGKISAKIDKLIASSGTLLSFGVNYNIEKTAFPSIFDNLLTAPSTGAGNTPQGQSLVASSSAKNIIQAQQAGTGKSDISDLYYKPGFFLNFSQPVLKSLRNSLFVFPSKIR